jgi:microcystin-dependent protein
MSTPFLGEIRLTSFNFAPRGWALCNGQLLAINQNQALFALLGTTYGGDGRVNFALPNLQGCVATGVGNTAVIGGQGGEESHVLSAGEMPAHVHLAMADATQGDATASNPLNAYPAYTAGFPLYSAGSSNMVAMASQMISSYGGGLAHENRQPYLVLNYIIAMAGIFPSQN